jgi:DinB superfamily
MNNIDIQINTIREAINQAFSNAERWLEKDISLQNYRPRNSGWTILEILEHIYLTNHFLLKLIEKGYLKALKNINNLDLESELKDYDFMNENLEGIGKHKSFIWNRPEHMIPMGTMNLNEISQNLNFQKNQCLNYLNEMPNGEGVLYKTTMTVNQLGKIDIYQYIYFLIMHITRHLTQMEKIEVEYYWYL